MNWRVVKLDIGVDFSKEAGGGSRSFTNTYAIPDDGRDLGDLTLAELCRYPAASATALLDGVVADHRRGDSHD